MMKIGSVYLLIVVAVLQLLRTESFLVPSPGSKVVVLKPPLLGSAFLRDPSAMESTKSSTALHFNKRQEVDGTNEGNYLFAIVILACVWVFLIPPEFRRMHFCGSERCEQNRAACYGCVTMSEWTNGIKDYYKNGGGIQFDFSIDPRTTKYWEEVFNSKK